LNKETILDAKVLIVDDNPSNVLLLDKLLKKAGYKNITTTQDSREVISIYKQLKPDVVLLDLAQPYLSGFEVMEQLHEIETENYLPIIVITAQDNNDTYGHQEGDECLKNVARQLKKSLKRPKDFVSRYGGEEFAITMPDTDEEGAVIVAEELRSSVENLQIPNEHSKLKPIVTISLGVATADGMTTINDHELIKQADEALYQAKKEGRNRAIFYKTKI